MVSLNQSFRYVRVFYVRKRYASARVRVTASFQNARICVGVSKTMHSIKLKSR